MAALLEADSLHTYYGESHVLQGVSLAVAAGESVGLLGRNGMGKTTLIRSVLGLVRAAQGRVSVRGVDRTRARAHEIARQGIGYVPEGRGIFPNLSVRENLVMAARPGVDGRRTWTLEKTLAAFPRLAERIRHSGAQLSGGEQQMLSIGRALMTNPDLLILDEATEGLAPMVVADIWRIIGEIRKSGIASLIVDRNYRLVLAHTDRCVVMEKGKIIFGGRSADVVRQPDSLARYLGV